MDDFVKSRFYSVFVIPAEARAFLTFYQVIKIQKA